MKIYFESFTCHEDVVREFALSDKELEGAEILYAIYDTDHYAGLAHVIFRQDGNVYEVNGSHCSCYGLGGQWSPEETTIQALLARPNVAMEAKEILQSIAIKNEGEK